MMLSSMGRGRLEAGGDAILRFRSRKGCGAVGDQVGAGCGASGGVAPGNPGCVGVAVKELGTGGTSKGEACAALGGNGLAGGEDIGAGDVSDGEPAVVVAGGGVKGVIAGGELAAGAAGAATGDRGNSTGIVVVGAVGVAGATKGVIIEGALAADEAGAVGVAAAKLGMAAEALRDWRGGMSATGPL